MALVVALALVGCENLLGGDDNANSNGSANGDNGQSGDDNDTGAVTDVATPEFSLESGQYVGAQILELTTETEGASIYYRLDFETPSTDDIEYPGTAIPIDSTVAVTAVAVLNDVVSEAHSEVYAIREASYTNQIANGDFSEGTNGWSLWVNPDSSASASWTTEDADGDGDEELAITIEDAGSAPHHVLPQFLPGFPTEEGDLFELSFTAWIETTSSHDFGFIGIWPNDNGIDTDGDGEVHEGFWYQHEVLTSTPRTFEKRVAIYVSPEHDSPRTGFSFPLGSYNGFEQAGTVYIDDVSLELVESPEGLEEIVSSAGMRSVLMEGIEEARDKETGAQRFESLPEADVTAYHVATISHLNLSPYDFEQVGHNPADFDMQTVRMPYFGNLVQFEVYGLPASNSDLVHLAELTQLDWVEVGYTTGYEGQYGGITDISSIGSLHGLRALGFRGDALSIDQIESIVTPQVFPLLDTLELRLNAVQPTTAEVDRVVEVFASFGSAGLQFRDVELEDSGITDEQFMGLYSGLLEPSTPYLEELWLSEWEAPGNLTNAVMDEIASLTQLKQLQIDNHQVTSISPVSALVNLNRLGIEGLDGIDHFSVLAELAELEELFLRGTHFGDSDWAAITGLSDMRILDLAHTEITDITPLQTMLENGAFSHDGEVDLRNNEQLDLNSTAPDNQGTLQALQAAGVEVLLN
jgi:hypothetical protein